MSASILNVAGLTKSYGYKSIFKNINFTLGEGELVLISGANGAGKTTLLKCILGLIKPQAGKVEVSPQSSFSSSNVSTSRNLAFSAVLQELMLYEDLTVRDNLDFFSKILSNYCKSSSQNSLSQKERTETLDSLLRDFELHKYINKKVSELSSGLKQRTAIVRAFLIPPRILILDEPFSYLDDKSQEMLVQYIEMYRKVGVAIIIVSHDRLRIESLYTKELLLEDSQITEIG